MFEIIAVLIAVTIGLAIAGPLFKAYGASRARASDADKMRQLRERIETYAPEQPTPAVSLSLPQDAQTPATQTQAEKLATYGVFIAQDTTFNGAAALIVLMRGARESLMSDYGVAPMRKHTHAIAPFLLSHSLALQCAIDYALRTPDGEEYDFPENDMPHIRDALIDWIATIE